MGDLQLRGSSTLELATFSRVLVIKSMLFSRSPMLMVMMMSLGLSKVTVVFGFRLLVCVTDG